MADRVYIHFQNGQVSILDDPRPISEAVKDHKYSIGSILTKAQHNMEKIRSSAELQKHFLRDARKRGFFWTAWRYGLMEYQAVQLTRELLKNKD